MSDFRPITDTISVAPQINADDIVHAAKDGIKLIINNRPDGEEFGQPTNAELMEIATQNELEWAYIPVAGGELTVEAIEQLAYALDGTEGKVLAYCRSGTRSCTLWGLAQAYTGSMATDDIIKHAATAGYDISNFAPTLEHLNQNAKS
jgi:uncharacterized protein (TIGR01244 family)